MQAGRVGPGSISAEIDQICIQKNKVWYIPPESIWVLAVDLGKEVDFGFRHGDINMEWYYFQHCDSRWKRGFG